MWDNQREFLNGIVRKFRPHKIVEIGVNRGGSSIIILNAIDDINQAKLYSIDLNSQKEVGECVNKYFPKFMKNWILFKGDLATAFLEKIGNDIDMVFIDTVHYQPGEILDFLMVLPFLKEEAIVIFHDIAFQIINQIRNYFTKYYTKECMIIFEEAIEFNRNFVKKYPKPLRYGFISD
jgi:predicted O-methyltransferase YrrM